jgi:lipopolysaccharide/colanic/teichoic acid biosynthesis glycosyltransferase
MSVHPILIDSVPPFLEGWDSQPSLLLLPIGADSLIGHLSSRLARVSPHRPIVLPPPDAAPGFAEEVSAAAPGARVVSGPSAVAELIATFEPSDTLLIVDPRSFPVEGFDPATFLAAAPQDPRWVVHFVTLGGGTAGTREYADIDAEGNVRRVRRYYESVTWPFITGVTASLLPVSALIGEKLDDLSLADLRGRLSGRGVPSRDVPLPGTAVDLHDETGLLALIERQVRRGAPADGPLLVGEGHDVHPTARLVGPVVLHRNVVIGERAVVMGPAVIGAGARVGAGAIVTQAIIAPGGVVPAGGEVYRRGPIAEATGETAASTRVIAGDASLDGHEGATADMPTPRSRYMAVKRLLEATAAGLLLLLLSPLLAVVALLVAIDSKGPIFFGHEREGLKGRRFRCLKFRTMQVNAAALERELHAQSLVDGPQFKLQKDPRVTRVGRVLRLTNLDELPQLINVARGEMGLVGPRPSPFRENQLCVPWRHGRLSVRPGITGLWQVCRHDRSEGDFHQWIEYDLLYVRHMSFALDVRIVVATAISFGGQKPVALSWVLPSGEPVAPTGPGPARSIA